MIRTNEEIVNLFESALEQMQTPAEPELLYAPIIYSMSGGGKRLRPVLLLITVDAFGGNVVSVQGEGQITVVEEVTLHAHFQAKLHRFLGN